MSRKCGDCKNLIPLRSMQSNTGVCGYHDARCSEDYPACKHFKRMKYSRNKVNAIFKNEKREIER